MTKNKENDFIKLKVVKEYCEKQGILIEQSNIDNLKLLIKQQLSNLPLKKDFINEQTEQPKV